MLPNYPLYYDGVNLAGITGVTVFNYDMNNLPSRDVKSNKLARQDGSITTSADFVQKIIPAYLEVCGGNRGQTEAVIATLKGYLQGYNKVLRASQYGQDISYQNVAVNEINTSWEGATALVELVFIASDPIGRETTLTTLMNSVNITTQAVDTPVVFAGSYNAEPIFSIVINDVTGGTGATLTVRNVSTGQGITIEHDYVDGDTVHIDSLNRIVTVNGGNVNYSGVFPRFSIGNSAIGWIDTFTTRDVDITAEYYKTYV